jgi:hypothetical protein
MTDEQNAKRDALIPSNERGLITPQSLGLATRGLDLAYGLDLPSPEEYAIYLACIERFYSETQLTIICDQTNPIWRNQANRKEFALAKEIIDDYDRKNDRSYLLSRFFFSTRCRLLTYREYEEVLQKGWHAFHSRFPNSQGILSFSRVGFNYTKDAAVLYEENRNHELQGGSFVFLKKENGEWIVKKTSLAWIT